MYHFVSEYLFALVKFIDGQRWWKKICWRGSENFDFGRDLILLQINRLIAFPLSSK